MSHSSRPAFRQNPAGTEPTAGPKVTDLNGNGPHLEDQQAGEHPTRRDGDVVEFRHSATSKARQYQARAWSAGTKLGILMLRAYLVISVLLLIVKAIQIGQG